ncbi:MAG: peptidase T [Planctomycetota bacterium]|nr:MAG: peptidase T [Planctomycetota bacterium]
MVTKPEPVVVVHGGAGDLASADDRRQYLEGVRGALEAGRAALAEGAEAAVLAAVSYMESETIMNAGRGAALAADGSAALDAGFMDGSNRRYGGVTGVRRCLHPVQIAARLAREGDFGRLVGPPDADSLADEFGLPHCEPEALVTERTRRLHAERVALTTPQGAPFLDTVGAVALDADGKIAAAVSTGGMSLKRPGRIGDSPVVGGGFWADDEVGACVTTGVGEVLMRQGTARRCVQLVADGASPEDAAARALDELLDHPGDQRGVSGLIFVDRHGRVVLDHNSREMSGGWVRASGELKSTHLWRPS